MSQPQVLELQDPDGAYALIQVVDEFSARVLSSNLLRKDRLLRKFSSLSWAEAALDQGGWSRLGPTDFLPGAPEPEEDPEREELGEQKGSAQAPLQLRPELAATLLVHPCPGCGREQEGQGGPPRDLEEAFRRALRSKKVPALRRILRLFARLRREREEEAA